MSTHGQVYWNELSTWDAEKAMAYYGAVLGWTFEEAPTAGTKDDRPYYIAKANGEMVAGIFTMIEPDFSGVPEHWFTYFAVDDLDAAIAASAAEGGCLRREPFEIPNFGRMAVVQGGTGAFQALIQPTGSRGA